MLREEMKDEADDNRDIAEEAIDYDDFKGALQPWLRKPEVIKYVRRQFEMFLKHHYEEKIHEMCQNNK